ncbi:SusC/RagA family TonB-linked outer membrane protein [Pedobacter nyackensis]|uniref:SusC/RagA family TonB-linked outer membrane protein n=1 Tax=Pedobacter nyackensis TaxID=475255 RepID=UPI00292EDDC8|nr:SusC/RagA family TonB-linked outer membrane protein [Pedobacter nyackensis]
MREIYSRCLSVLLLSLLTIAAYAQKNISGTVKDATGTSIPAVSITVKGTKNGVSSDANGKYSISAKQGEALVFRYIGYTSQEVIVGTSTTIDIILKEENNNLNEVVVTALGIKKEKKAVGYAIQEVKGETLVEAKEPNLVNALSGKVAGLQVTRSSNGPGGSSRITLRGNNSLRTSDSNQPLIVVDGVPMDNFTGAKNNDFNNPTLDMGNGLADISAEDIESMSVLKGPAAAALYGSRAGNGVILITTKSGKAQKGLGIAVSSSFGVETILTNPDMQNSFGQGELGSYNSLKEGSWGPKIEGQSVKKWDGSMSPLAAYDNVGNYFNTGLSYNNNISFQQQFKSLSVYTSYNRADEGSMIPGLKLTRNNFTGRAVTKFGKDDRWSTDTKIQYSHTNAQNRPSSGARGENVFRSIYFLPRSLDLRDFKAATNDQGKMLWYAPGSFVNPYWNKQYNLNQDIRNRFLMSGSLSYKFNSWLTAEVKGGADLYTTNADARVYDGSPIINNGRYSIDRSTFSETNFSTLWIAKKDNLFGKLGGSLTLGGNLMSQRRLGADLSTGELVVPNFFSLKNGKDALGITETDKRKKINSVYGSGQINWDGYFFVDATFRNDWSSSLIKANQSYFYPSVSTSLVFSEMVNTLGGTLPSWLSYGKVRASYAQVGNDLEPYELYNVYKLDKDPNNGTTASRNDVLFDSSVRSELIKSFEVGMEMRFLNGRVGIDAAYYKSNATRQLLNIPMDPLSGYKSKKINGGDIQNKGVEITLDGKVLNNNKGLNWNMMLNYSTNNNTVEALTNDISRYPLGGYDDLKIWAKTGERFGEIYGSKFARVTDKSSPYFGQLLLNEEGLPTRGEEDVRLGNQQATAMLGFTNSFAYKGFGLSFQIDGRFGGKIFSATNASMRANGTAAATAPNGLRENMTVQGVVLNGTGYVLNTKSVSPERYYTWIAAYGNVGVGEANIYDATNIRLRNVQLSYDLPTKFLSKTPIQRAKIGLSCNNAWLITGDMDGIDPESVYSTNTTATGFENGSAPTSRTFLFNLTLGF